MAVRIATAQDAAGIVALHKAANPFGDWFRNPLLKADRVAYEDLTPLERCLHGGFWMDLSLFRRHFHEYKTRGFPVLVAEEQGRIVGECEVWLDEEPPPFGKYAEIEMIEALGRTEVERELVQDAAERVRKMGYEALDMAPAHGGGAAAARAFDFHVLWDTRTLEADPKTIDRPDGEFGGRFLAGDFGDLAGLLSLNHREPARWRYETLTARWPAAQVAGLLDATEVVAMAVDAAEPGRFSVIAARHAWVDPPVAEIDVWMDSGGLQSGTSLAPVFEIAVEIARRLAAKRIVTFAPPAVAETLRGIGFTGGTTPDPWLRWTFEGASPSAPRQKTRTPRSRRG